LTAKASAVCRVRILLSDSESAQLVIADAEQGRGVTLTEVTESALEVHRARGHLEPLLEKPGIEIRASVASRFNSIL
jgi:hypothetical protein